MIIPLEHYLIFGAVLFTIGIYGILVRRNIIGILISIEMILNAVNVNLVAFSRSTSASPETGQIFAIFVIALAAAAAVVGLALVLALFRVRKTVLTDEITLLKW
ncbi:MAG: NADH-quinone oxidoreductase subunit K [Omnitrophica bacterium GWA2_52_8]|nr:MAG: NADH-quinone oxidoreductase subunit K [Omnitrophica bacterium GWA2_52_8]